MNLSDSLDLKEKAAMVVLVVVEFESVIKIEVVPLLEAQCPLFGGSGPLF